MSSPDYSHEQCGSTIGRYVRAMVQVERLRDKIDEEYERAPGRLLDKFEELPRTLPKYLADEDSLLTNALVVISRDAVQLINAARDGQLKRRKTSTSEYLPSYKQDLVKTVDRLEKVLMEQALDAAQKCICSKQPTKVMAKRNVDIDWNPRFVSPQ